jgi:zinc and cadmium transporter
VPLSLTIIGTVTLVSLVSFVGILLFSISEKHMRRSLLYLVSLSAGVLLGDVFIHLLPELSEDGGFSDLSIAVILVGIVASFVIEKIIHWRHCHILPSAEHYHPVGPLTLIGDGIHNFVDGTLIAGSFLVSPEVGLATAIAIALHEIPQEISDFAVLLYSGFTRRSALLWNLVSGITAIAGAALVIIAQDALPALSTVLLPFAAGNFLYIASADLLPELHRETSLKSAVLQLLFISVGIFSMYGLTVFV